MTDTCIHCHLPVYTMWRPVTGEKLVHRGTPPRRMRHRRHHSNPWHHQPDKETQR
ncbi:hypothetical protein GS580_27665 [Rhodococcus hoagii]|nr:hypothetical protein [Prescottella equi]